MQPSWISETHFFQVGTDDKCPHEDNTIAPDEIELSWGCEQADNCADLAQNSGLTLLMKRLLVTSFRQVDKVVGDALLVDSAGSPWKYYFYCSSWYQYDASCTETNKLHQSKVYSINDDVLAWKHMMTSSNGNIFRVTGHLCGEFTGPRRIPHTKASEAELWCFLWSASE